MSFLGQDHAGLYKSPTKEESETLREEEDKIGLLILDLKEGKLCALVMKEEGKMFHKLQVQCFIFSELC